MYTNDSSLPATTTAERDEYTYSAATARGG